VHDPAFGSKELGTDVVSVKLKKLFSILSSNVDLPFKKKKKHRFHGSSSGHTS
jgi:hypothetical protein